MPRSPTRPGASASSSTTSAPASPTRPTPPTCAPCSTDCTPSSGCTPPRKTRTIYPWAMTPTRVIPAASWSRPPSRRRRPPGDPRACCSEGHGAGFRLSGSDTGEPGVELVSVCDLAAKADVAIGADGDQATAGGTGEAVDADQRAKGHGAGPVRVAVEEHVHAWAGDQFVQP